MRRRQFLASTGAALLFGAGCNHGPKCHACKGKGSTECYQCNGQGSQRYTNRTREKIEWGSRKCSVCAGKGRLDCSTCNGTGRPRTGA